METLFLIHQLGLPTDIQRKIVGIHKHELLEPHYRRQFTELNRHLLYYAWMNKKIRRVGLHQEDPRPDYSLLQTIKDFDYYKPFKVA